MESEEVFTSTLDETLSALDRSGLDKGTIEFLEKTGAVLLDVSTKRVSHRRVPGPDGDWIEVKTHTGQKYGTGGVHVEKYKNPHGKLRGVLATYVQEDRRHELAGEDPYFAYGGQYTWDHWFAIHSAKPLSEVKSCEELLQVLAFGAPRYEDGAAALFFALADSPSLRQTALDIVNRDVNMLASGKASADFERAFEEADPDMYRMKSLF